MAKCATGAKGDGSEGVRRGHRDLTWTLGDDAPGKES
jgi:hypothetical protein